MSDFSALASLKWVELRNRSRLFYRQSRFKVGVILLFSLGFWFSLYRVFYAGLEFIHRMALGYSFQGMIDRMFYIFFFSLTMMLIFSNAIIGYSSYFKARETGFLLATPARPENVFFYKFIESLGFSSWAFLFLGTPLMAAYGRLFDVPWHFYLTSSGFLAVYMFIPAALGAIIVMVVTVYVPRTRQALVVGSVLAAVLVILIFISTQVVGRRGQGLDLQLASDIFKYTEWFSVPLLPSYWLAEGVLDLSQGRYGRSFFFGGMILSTALFLLSLTYVVSGHLMPRGWHVSQGLRSTKRYAGRGLIDRFFTGLLFFVDRKVRFIVVKDVKSFLRDPVQWSQFLIFFGLLAIYFLNLRSFSYEDRSMLWKNLIAQMNLLATSLTLATFASRFIFPQLSLEGRRFWVIGMAPMDREKILFGKLALSFSCSLLISETLIALSSWMLQSPFTLTVLHSVSLFGICLGLSGLSVGLGALYPNFNEDNPSKIVSGFGGTLNLVLSLFFVLTVLSLQAIPCFLYYGLGKLTGDGFRWLIVGSMVAIAIVSLITCLIPLRMGLKAIKRLEI